MDYQAVFVTLFVALAKLFVFAVFIAAIIEVIKAIALKGVWGLIKELVASLGVNHPLSTDSVKMLNFLIALLYCKVFDYGVMTNVLQITLVNNKFGSFLDYFGTAALVYNGAGWAFDKFAVLRKQIDAAKSSITTSSSSTASESKVVTTTDNAPASKVETSKVYPERVS